MAPLDLVSLASRLGIAEFRPRQRRAIEALVAGKDVLAIIPTGGGKSAIYQGATLAHGGVTVIVSPLLALQADQIRAIEEADIGRAVSIDGSMSESERSTIFERVQAGEAQFVFATPEILVDEAITDRLRAVGVGLFAVDEAHCIVTWGQGFRPDFVALGDVRRRLGSPTTVALTGSADPRIRADICRSLDMAERELITDELVRANIELSVTSAATRAAATDRMIDHLDTTDGKALAYVATRKLAEQIASQLDGPDRRALPYHGGLSSSDKAAALELIRSESRSIVVATTAFGMGIDIPDISSVVHLDMPDSLLAYYQEVGRGGRDGSSSGGAVFVSLRSRSRRAFGSGVRRTTVSDCATVFVAIQNGAHTRRQLMDQLAMNAGRVARALSVLHQAGAVATTPRLGVVAESDPDLIESICRDREEFDRSQLLAVERYRSVRHCRWAQILTSLGEPMDPCGHCDVCAEASANGDASTTHDDRDPEFPVGAPVVHAEFGGGMVTSRRDDTITVAFTAVGPKDLAADLCVEEGLLRNRNAVDS